jgi:outer membrane protein assembly factor BamB
MSVIVVAALTGLGSPSAGAAGGANSSAPLGASKSPVYWPEAHQNPQLTGVTSDASISDTNAGKLGVHWMANLTAQSLTSPVVSYNQTLGKTLVYAGSEGGWFSAFVASTGATVWSVNLGSAVRSTPVIDGAYIWVASTYAPELFKLNAATGAQLCQAPIFSVAEASPIVVTPPGGTPTVYMGSNDTDSSGPLYSINESTCAVNWAFTGYAKTTGLWDMISYGVDATGEPLVLFGTADPDSGVYALDAVTGHLVWRFQTYNPNNGPADVGAGVTIALPGTAAGGKDGMAYVPSKDGNVYGLDMTTGAQVWVYNYAMGVFPPVGNGSRATAALTGTQLVFGTTTGVFDVNALTGALIWQSVIPKGDEVLGAPAIAGPAGHQVVLATDIDGRFMVLSLATGALLYSYQTQNYVGSSPADSAGNVYLTSADGFLYDFTIGGSNSSPPSTVISSPTQGATVPNPNAKPLVISGTASDSTGVSSVKVTVQEDGESGQWWSATKKAWQPGPFNNAAVLATPGATTTSWSLQVPMPARGTVVEVRASAVNSGQVADTQSGTSQATSARIDFTLAPSLTAPTLAISAKRVAPGGQATLSGGGYRAGESVVITLPTTPVTTLTTIVAGPTGLLAPTAVTIPVGLNFGPMTVTATGQSSGKSSSAPVVISNNWDQFGNSASKSNFELNDSSLNNNVAASGRFFLNQAFNFPTGSPIRTTVAIDSGTAFFGDDAGDFFAINVANGAPIWQNTYSAGISSSAAVDSSMVIFGTNADSVVAVNESTGAPIWTTATGGEMESSPAVYGGVVYIGCDNGMLYALSEQTGAVLWTTTLGGPVQSSPAVDAVHQTVVVGDASGHVTALAIGGTGMPAAGTVVWSATTGGAVVAAPTYFANKIFVGSTDGSEYAFNGKTGALDWTFKTGGPITANNVTFGTDIGVGSQDGTIYYLSSVDGSVQNSLSGSVPIVGLSGSVNFAVATLSNGSAEATRITGIDQTWKYNTDGFGFASAPVTNNGNVYLTGLDDNLHVFSATGRPIY